MLCRVACHHGPNAWCAYVRLCCALRLNSCVVVSRDGMGLTPGALMFALQEGAGIQGIRREEYDEVSRGVSILTGRLSQNVLMLMRACKRTIK